MVRQWDGALHGEDRCMPSASPFGRACTSACTEQDKQGQAFPCILDAECEVHAPLQGCLGMAFVVEGLLFAFHLEGSELNWKAHLLLVMSILAAVGAILGEIAAPGNVLLGVARAQLVMLQGVWFMQIAKLLFEGAHDSPRLLCEHLLNTSIEVAQVWCVMR